MGRDRLARGAGALGTALILFVPKVTLWRPLATGLAFLAGATFYIYLMHMAMFHIILYELEIDSKPLELSAALGAALAGGVAAYLAWTRAIAIGETLFRRIALPRMAATRMTGPTAQ